MKLRVYFTHHHSKRWYSNARTGHEEGRFQKTPKQMDFDESTTSESAKEQVCAKFGKLPDMTNEGRANFNGYSIDLRDVSQYVEITSVVLIDETKEPEKLDGWNSVEQFLPLTMKPVIPKHQ